MRIYSGRNMATANGSHVHEGEIDLPPGAEAVIPKAAILNRMKNADVSVKTGQMLPSFNMETVSVNGKSTSDVVGSIIEALKTGDVKLANTGTKKAVVALRLIVVEVEDKPKPPPPVVADGE